jgi:hypothetical protein
MLVAGAKDVAGDEVFGGTEAVGAVDVEGVIKGAVDADVIAGDEAPGAWHPTIAEIHIAATKITANSFFISTPYILTQFRRKSCKLPIYRTGRSDDTTK